MVILRAGPSSGMAREAGSASGPTPGPWRGVVVKTESGEEASLGQVRWEKSPFNVRQQNVTNLLAMSQRNSASSALLRIGGGAASAGSRAQQLAALSREREGCCSLASKSLDLLRRNVQRLINREIDAVIQAYLQKFFRPGVENIRLNQGDGAVNEEHLNSVCRQILEEAKRMYFPNPNPNPDSSLGSNPGQNFHLHQASSSSSCSSLLASLARNDSPAFISNNDSSDSETGAALLQMQCLESAQRKRKESDTDSEASSSAPTPNPRKRSRASALPPAVCAPPLPAPASVPLSLSATPLRLPPQKADGLKREAFQWDPDKLTSDTLFIMGARANKALGFGQTRGRLYMKHPELFKYPGDTSDKEWLAKSGLMPSTGGKAYLMIVEDVLALLASKEYRHSPNLQLAELLGFRVPPFLLEKVKRAMAQARSLRMAKGDERGAGACNTATEGFTMPRGVEVASEESTKHLEGLSLPYGKV